MQGLFEFDFACVENHGFYFFHFLAFNFKEAASEKAKKAMTTVNAISWTERSGVLVAVSCLVGVAVGLAELVTKFWVCGVELTKGVDVGRELALRLLEAASTK